MEAVGSEPDFPPLNEALERERDEATRKSWS
jgi:hypothetical protein